MEFLDNSGHIFSVESYKTKPIGYEFNESSYIFWIDNLDQSYLSVNQYYIKSIYAVIPLTNYIDLTGDDEEIDERISKHLHIEAECISNIYKLIPASRIQKELNNHGDINELVSIVPQDNKGNEVLNKVIGISKLTTENDDDFMVLKVTEEYVTYVIIPIYVIGMCKEEGSWISNIILHISSTDPNTNQIVNEEWCPISVGGQFQEQYEALVINGKNMGINLPKDIMKALYQTSFYNSVFNEELFNEKLKEYFLNYMGIRGEIGNYASIEKSINWFGWRDKITLQQLFKNDNIFKEQYILNYFTLNSTFLESFKRFTTSAYIKLSVKLNTEEKDSNGNVIHYDQDFSTFDFNGEGTPKLLDLTDTYKFVRNGIGEDNTNYKKFVYLKKYYDFTLNEIGLKLMALRYYFKEYFLPLHIEIHSASLNERVYTNDMKYSQMTQQSIVSPTILTESQDIHVQFNHSHKYFFCKQSHLIDDQFNEFNYTNIGNKTLYSVYDTCINIPIKFISPKKNQYYDCHLILEKNNDINDEYLYTYYSTDSFNLDDDFFIINGDNILFTKYKFVNDNHSLYKDPSKYYLPLSFSFVDSEGNIKKDSFNIFYKNLEDLHQSILTNISVNFGDIVDRKNLEAKNVFNKGIVNFAFDNYANPNIYLFSYFDYFRNKEKYHIDEQVLENKVNKFDNLVVTFINKYVLFDLERDLNEIDNNVTEEDINYLDDSYDANDEVLESYLQIENKIDDETLEIVHITISYANNEPDDNIKGKIEFTNNTLVIDGITYKEIKFTENQVRQYFERSFYVLNTLTPGDDIAYKLYNRDGIDMNIWIKVLYDITDINSDTHQNIYKTYVAYDNETFYNGIYENSIKTYKYINNELTLVDEKDIDFISLPIDPQHTNYKYFKYNNYLFKVGKANTLNNINVFNPSEKALPYSIIPNFRIAIKSNSDSLKFGTYKDDKFYVLSNDSTFVSKYYLTNQSYYNKYKKIVSVNNEIDLHCLNYYNTDKFLNKNSSLVYESHFRFIQSNDCEYKNFVLCPKLFNQNIFFFENRDFILKLLVNGKWFYYNFFCTMPELHLELGKLAYEYWDDSLKYNTYFDQIRYLDNKQIVFNSYMHEPGLVTQDNINFISDLVKDYNKRNLIYINKEFIEDQLVYYINYHHLKIYFTKDFITKSIYKVNKNNIEKLSTITLKLPLEDVHEIVIKDNDEILERVSNDIYKIIDTDKYTFKEVTFTVQESKFSKYYDTLNKDIIVLIDNNDPNDETNKYIISQTIFENQLIDKYKFSYNLPNELRYKNQILLFDLKQKNHKLTNILFYKDKLSLSINGIVFSGISDIENRKTIFTVFGKLYDEKELDDMTISNQLDTYGIWINDASTITQENWENLVGEEIFKESGSPFVLPEDNNYEQFYCYYDLFKKQYTLNPNTTIENQLSNSSKLVSNNNQEINEAIKSVTIDEIDYPLITLNNTKDNNYYIYKDNNYIKINIKWKYVRINDENEIELHNNPDIEEDETIGEISQISIDYPTKGKSNMHISSYTIQQDSEDEERILHSHLLSGKYKILIKFYYEYTYNNLLIKFKSAIKRVNHLTHDIYFEALTKEGYYTQVHKVDEIIYKDTRNNELTKVENIIYDNPTQYWWSIDDKVLNEKLKDHKYPKFDKFTENHNNNLTIKQFSSKNENSTDITKLEEFIKDIGETQEYINYLEYDMLLNNHLKGTYQLSYETKNLGNNDIQDINTLFRLRAIIYRKDSDTPEIYIGNPIESDDNVIFELDGTEESVKIYIQIDNSQLRTLQENGTYICQQIENIQFIPYLFIVEDTYEDIPFIPNDLNIKDSNILKYHNYLIYSDSEAFTKNIVDLYNKFFYVQYTILDQTTSDIAPYLQNNNSNVEVATSDIYSILPKISKTVCKEMPWLSLDDRHIEYDFYLMHDYNKWYGIYISKNTLDKVTSIDHIYINDYKDKYSDDKEYKLEFVKSSNQFLINRYRFIPCEDEVKHFDSKDIICCNITDNDRLGINFDVSSKYQVEFRSLRKNQVQTIESNQNMTIISIPDNNTEYHKGYYQINTRYSLDRFSNQQFKQSSVFLVK